MARETIRKSYAECPFYRHDDGSTRIYCEGISGRKGTTINIFQTKVCFCKHLEEKCCGKYFDCILYQAICKNYYKEK